jgi:uncharacterized protein YbjT (DUF2867 family)
LKTLVIGGTGLIGTAVVDELLRRQADLRLLVREKKASLPPGVEVALGDLLDPPAVARAMDGCDQLYLLNAVTPDELTQGLIAYDLAKRRKLRHVVYHSVFQVDKFHDVPHFAAKSAIESALREFDVPWTVIRPNYFFQNDKTLRDALLGSHVYPAPLGDIGISAVDVRDIAEATAIALTTEGHDGRIYNLNGPDLLSGPTAAEIWSRVLGQTIRYGGHDMDAFEGALRARAPAWSAFDLRMMFQGYLERGFAAEPGDVETLTTLIGHPPRTYEAFARETAAEWLPLQEMSATRS